MTEATAAAGALERLSDEGVSLRLDDLSRERTSGAPRRRGPAGAGANGRRPLGASTGVSDPAHKDTLYVDEPPAPGTVGAMPEATPDAAPEHGDIAGDTVTGGCAAAHAGLAAVEALGVAYDEVVTRSADEGVAEFAVAWQDPMDAVVKSLTSKGVDAT
ncbi:hypothetical protein GCM10010269_67270 [Streptomyces humidus]|uniref:Uncharacterized protein n=1 Tax=Streptomyces humidus TaxID=52259 RepID=A0A918L7X0_9ACTN|nr:hypothetical protein GCM10010269_67270 [Streptomyces humidus]